MARRNTLTFSMSFLDVISCGFGAVVLFYTIISAQAGLYRIKENSELTAEAKKLELEVLDGYKHLAELRNALDSTEDRTVRAAGMVDPHEVACSIRGFRAKAATTSSSSKLNRVGRRGAHIRRRARSP